MAETVPRAGISRVCIENFKGIRDRVEIPIRPITLLFGANSAGKSTIIHALHYLREVLERGNLSPDRTITGANAIDLGGFASLVHQHELDREIRISVSVCPGPYVINNYVEGQIYEPDGSVTGHSDEPKWSFLEVDLNEAGLDEVGVSVSIGWDADNERPWVSEYATSVNGEVLIRVRNETKQSARISEINFNHPVFSALAGNDEDSDWGAGDELEGVYNSLTSGDEQGLPLNQETAIPQWGDLLEFVSGRDLGEGRNLPAFRVFVSQALVGIGEHILRELRGVRYLGPMRKVPDRNYRVPAVIVPERWADGMAAWDVLHKDAARPRDSKLIDLVSDYLRDDDKLNLGYSIRAGSVREIPVDSYALRTLQALSIDSEDSALDERIELIWEDIIKHPVRPRLILSDRKNSVDVEPYDIGVGISQVLPVLVGTLYQGCRCFAVEQPELHVHPAVQCELGDVFISQSQQDPERRFLLETHSEHLVLRILRRIREQAQADAPTVSAGEVAVYCFQESDSGTEISEMRISKEGEFQDPWPGGFFPERFRELFGGANSQ